MNDDEKEKELFSLMTPKLPEAFWARQKAGIISASARPAFPRAWLLAPAAAAAAVVLVLLAKPRVQVPEPSATVSTAFLEHLDLLDDMDVLEAVSEEEL